MKKNEEGLKKRLRGVKEQKYELLEEKRVRDLNNWGLQPVEYKILIEPDEVEEFAGRGNIIVKPDHARDKEQVQKIKGTLIAVGGNAFSDWSEPIPKVGDVVYFAKYAGIRLQRDDGQDEEGRYKYKHACLCNDKDIAAIITSESGRQNLVG